MHLFMWEERYSDIKVVNTEISPHLLIQTKIMLTISYAYSIMHLQLKGDEYLYVHNVGLFQILENGGEGNCLFRSISQALYNNSQKYHHAIRKSVVRHITTRRMWNRFGELITRYWKLESFPSIGLSSSPRHWKCFRIGRKCGKEKSRENKWKYRQMMSQGAFPGTSYELRAAADLFGFHVDFLVDLSNTRYSSQTADDHLRLYQFFSCRNNGCQVSVAGQYPHLYFLHRRDLQSEEGGHWELMIPILLLVNTMPLHRKIYAVSSIGCRQLEEADVNDHRDLLMRMNETGKDIDILVSNGNIIPFEDPEWPPDDTDNFIGCAQPNHQMTKPKGSLCDRLNSLISMNACKAVSNLFNCLISSRG